MAFRCGSTIHWFQIASIMFTFKADLIMETLLSIIHFQISTQINGEGER